MNNQNFNQDQQLSTNKKQKITNNQLTINKYFKNEKNSFNSSHSSFSIHF